MSKDKELKKDDEFFVLEENENQKESTFHLLAKKLVFFVYAPVVGLFILFCIGLTLHTYKIHVNWIKNEVSHVQFPLTGENLVLSKVKTHWEHSPNDDKIGSQYIPTSEITISKKSTSGKIRGFYVNAKGQYVGEPLRIEFSDGSFSDGKTVTFTSTSGFDNESDFNAYFSGYTGSWYLEILEGTTESKTLSEFKKLAKIPLYYTVKEAPKSLTP